MSRLLLGTALHFAFAASMFGATASAQQWAREMFSEHQHDFGTVARGAKAEYVFTFKNLYKETVHVAGVRASCGCATPRILTDTVKSLETGRILVTFNTLSFLGRRSATITVTFDRPYFAEVRLKITGYVRRDVVCDPGKVDFGTVKQGESATKVLKVRYAGRSDWKITDVRSPYEHLEVRLKEMARTGGFVTYEMQVRLRPDAQPGWIDSYLDIITDDTHLGAMRLDVRGRVLSPIDVPSHLLLGTVAPGESITKNLVLRCTAPCRITDIACDDERFTFDYAKKPRKVHVIRVRFAAGTTPGAVSVPLRITTDRADGRTATVTVTGTVGS